MIFEEAAMVQLLWSAAVFGSSFLEYILEIGCFN